MTHAIQMIDKVISHSHKEFSLTKFIEQHPNISLLASFIIMPAAILVALFATLSIIFLPISLILGWI